MSKKIVEIAEMIKSNGKPVQVETDTMSFSASYWSNYGKERIYITKNTDAGAVKFGYIDVQKRELVGVGGNEAMRVQYIELALETLRTWEKQPATDALDMRAALDELERDARGNKD